MYLTKLPNIRNFGKPSWLNEKFFSTPFVYIFTSLYTNLFYMEYYMLQIISMFQGSPLSSPSLSSRTCFTNTMSAGPLTVEIICTFILAVLLIHRYGDWRKQHVLVTLATFVAWYFSLMIIFILPLDVSSVSTYLCE